MSTQSTALRNTTLLYNDQRITVQRGENYIILPQGQRLSVQSSSPIAAIFQSRTNGSRHHIIYDEGDPELARLNVEIGKRFFMRRGLDNLDDKQQTELINLIDEKAARQRAAPQQPTQPPPQTRPLWTYFADAYMAIGLALLIFKVGGFF